MSLKMLVAGLNTYHSLFTYPSNSEDQTTHKHVYPPRKVILNDVIDQVGISSISMYYDHSIIVFKNGRIAGVGNNSEGQLGPYFDHLIYDQLTYGHGFVGTLFISAVCGAWYTLYMHTCENKESPRATICFLEDDGNRNFLYYDISALLSDQKVIPAAIFGGNERSAIIDEKGNIILISKESEDSDLNLSSSFNNSSNSLLSISTTKIKCEYLYFPRSFFSEKAICVACCNNFTLVLTKSGKVYGNGKINQENDRHASDNDKSKGITDRNILIEIEELKGHNIVQISGTFQHCLAVSSEGRVFSVGSNYNGQLGLGPNIKNTWIFTELENIYPKYRIINTSSGSGHSIMISSEGQVLTCGNNGYHQLFQDENDQTLNFYAREVPNESLKGRATFSIAGNCISGIFVNTEPPPNQPNTPLKSNRPYIMPEKSFSDMYKHARNEMARLHFQIEIMSCYEEKYDKMKLKCDSDEAFYNDIIHSQSSEIMNLKDEIEKMARNIANLEFENKSLTTTIEDYYKSHSLDEFELISQKDQDVKEYIKQLGIDFDEKFEKNKNINFVDFDTIASLNLQLIDSNDSSFNEFKFEKEKSYSLTFFRKSGNSADYGEQLKRFFIEYEVLSRLNHPNIIKTVGFMKGDSKMSAGILQEYFITENFTLNYLKDQIRTEPSSIDTILTKILSTILSAVKYAHEEGIQECHLNPSNIKIDTEHNEIKLLLRPKFYQNQKSDQNSIEKDKYDAFVAPEIKKEGKIDNDKSDVYSIGVFIYYLLYFIEKMSENQIENFEEEFESNFERFRNSDNKSIPEKMNITLKEMTEKELEKRLTITDAELKLKI